ncbi:hypothetical protein ACYOEI_24140, partial [Singulisphaera rosea]
RSGTARPAAAKCFNAARRLIGWCNIAWVPQSYRQVGRSLIGTCRNARSGALVGEARRRNSIVPGPIPAASYAIRSGGHNGEIDGVVTV